MKACQASNYQVTYVIKLTSGFKNKNMINDAHFQLTSIHVDELKIKQALKILLKFDYNIKV